MAVSLPPGEPATATPCRLRRLIRPPLWRSAARGIAAVLIVTAIVVPLVCLGWTMLGVFAAIAVGLNLGLWAGRDSGLASLAGAVMIPVVGLAITLWSDVQLFGPGSGTIAPSEIRHHPYAARFRFTDARIATEFTALADAHRVTGATIADAWRVAPIVPSNWTPLDPVPAWAVAVTSGYGPLDFRGLRNWQQDYRAGVRYVSTAFSPAHTAIERALARYDLTVEPNAPLIYWVEEPQRIIADERTFLAWIMFAGAATWFFFLIGEALVVSAGAPSDAERGPPGAPQAREA
jgi:hypothetical protein